MNDIIKDVLLYMTAHLKDDLTIQDVAYHFGYSKFHFSREFKKLTGFSAADYLSSIKVEYAKKELLEKNYSVTDSSFDAGYSSLGTFSTNFAKKTGLTPREYKYQIESLYGLTKAYEQASSKGIQYRSKKSDPISQNQLAVTVHYLDDYKPGVTFIGLFNHPIPNHKLIVGTALTHQTAYQLTSIPDGTYYLLACSIEKTINPLRYFLLSDCHRGRADTAIKLPEQSNNQIDIYLREPLPEDPPILINLPKLLADSFKSRNL